MNLYSGVHLISDMLKKPFLYDITHVLQGWKKWVHIGFWLSHLVIRLTISNYHGPELSHNLIAELLELPIKILLSYSSIFLIERFLTQLRLIPFTIGIALCLVATWFLKRGLDVYLVFPMVFDRPPNPNQFWLIWVGFKNLIYIYPTVVSVLAITYTIEWFQNEKKAKQLEKLNAENELKYLKSKLQPHFLFNTLNNIYSLSLHDTEKTPEAILQLSDVLSYMLYRSDKTYIPLEDEVKLMLDLFELEKLRTSNEINFVFEKPEQLGSVSVPPLLLFPLAENAFKYGIGDDERQPNIVFSLDIRDNQLVFQTKNDIMYQTKTEKMDTKGVGLDTLKKRLDILFEDDYTLDFNQTESVFSCRLQIPIGETDD